MFIEGAEHTQDLQTWIELGLFDHADGFLKLHQSGQRKESGRDRDEHLLAGSKSINGQASPEMGEYQ